MANAMLRIAAIAFLALSSAACSESKSSEAVPCTAPEVRNIIVFHSYVKPLSDMYASKAWVELADKKIFDDEYQKRLVEYETRKVEYQNRQKVLSLYENDLTKAQRNLYAAKNRLDQLEDEKRHFDGQKLYPNARPGSSEDYSNRRRAERLPKVMEELGQRQIAYKNAQEMYRGLEERGK